MQTIETMVDVDESRRISVQLPIGVLPGRHQVLLVIDEKINGNRTLVKEPAANRLANYRPPAEGESCVGPLGITVFNSGPMLLPSSFGREELYDDEVSP